MKNRITDKKTFREKLNEFANRLEYTLNETDDKWVFTRGEVQISLRKSRSESVDARRAETILNEGMTDLPSAGFYGTSSGHPYCEYKIIPLVHNLEQKLKKKENKGAVIQIGNYVQGKTSDGKIFNGKIQKFKRDAYNDIKEVIILAKENGKIVSLIPESVHLSDPYPESKKREGKFDSFSSSFGIIGSYQGGF